MKLLLNLRERSIHMLKKRYLLFFTMFVIACLGLFLFKQKSDELNVIAKMSVVKEEKPFVLVIASYNNEKYYKGNLDSIFSQEYQNYRVIYIDDASTDQTYSCVKNYIAEKGMQDKVTLIHNEVNRKALHNLYTAIHSCNNEEIVVIVDGDDRLTNPLVLSDLNRYYQNDVVWMTYGQYIRYPDYQIGMCAPVKKSTLKEAKVRFGKWQYSHLRTFYAGLFKRIKLEDLMYEDEIFQVTYDLAIMYPMLEMAREHAFFTPEVSYEYNYETPLTDAKVRLALQEKMERYIRALPVYNALKEHPKNPILKEGCCDLVVFTYNRPMQLYAFLESLYLRVKGFRNVMCIARIDPEFREGFEIVKKAFPEVKIYEQSKEPRKDFKPTTMELVFGETGKGANFILFAVDDIVITDDIDLKKDMQVVVEKGASGFYYRLGDHVNYCFTLHKEQGIPKLLDLGEDTYAWRFSYGNGDWNYPHSVDLVLYRKQDIQDDLEKTKFTFPNDFEGNWAKLARLDKIGLCHKRAKMVNIPMNVVSQFQNFDASANTISAEELNEYFMHGLKINIETFHLINNLSAHADIMPEFIVRGDSL